LSEVAYHLHLDEDEGTAAEHALSILISDEAHEPEIRALARAVLALLHEGAGGPVTLALTAEQMKITHTAVKLMLDDSQREQHEERRLLWSILQKLPDEHAIRAIDLP
jgi:hypothetical protein